MSFEQHLAETEAARETLAEYADESIQRILDQLKDSKNLWGLTDEDIADINFQLHQSGTSQIEDEHFTINRDLEGGFNLHEKQQAA